MLSKSDWSSRKLVSYKEKGIRQRCTNIYNKAFFAKIVYR